MANPLSLRGFEFQGNTVRCVGTDRDLWFVAKDVAEALGMVWASTTLASIPSEWRGVREVLTPQINQHGRCKNGFVKSEVIVINEAAVYKLAFRSNKPSADAFTNWVASEVLPAIRKTGAFQSERRAKYERQGKQLEWIETREEGIEARKGFTDTLKDHGVKGPGYPECTNAIYKPVLGGSAALVKINRGLKPKANLRDALSTLELTKVKFAELLAVVKIEGEQLQGNERCAEACKLSGQAVATAERTVREVPLNPPSGNS
jgi:prophage antirepressor-like protein